MHVPESFHQNHLTVPRRELSGILLGIKKVPELAEVLEIAKDKGFKIEQKGKKWQVSEIKI